jgi:hypothetical protein
MALTADRFYTRLYFQTVSVRVSAAGIKFHTVVMPHIGSHFANVHLVRTLPRSCGIPFSPLSFTAFFSPRCRGLKVLVDLLDEDFAEQSELIVHALNGIGSVFELQSPTSTKNDFCRLFIREGLLDPLSSALLNVMASRGEAAADMKRKIIQILLVFCQVSQSDVHVRNALGTRKVVRRAYLQTHHRPPLQLTEIGYLQGCCERANFSSQSTSSTCSRRSSICR